MFIKRATSIKQVIDTSLLDPDSAVVLHAFRFIKNFAKYLTEAANAQEPESRFGKKKTYLLVDLDIRISRYNHINQTFSPNGLSKMILR